MTRSRTLHILVLFAVAAAFALSPASAEPHRKRERPPTATGLWGTVTSLWEVIGCKIDPHGGCGTDEPAAPPETALWEAIGCKLDPNGGCGTDEPAAPPETDIGCKIDPNGGCAPES